MDFVGIIDNSISLLRYLPPLIFVMGLIIFVHELGHFCVARWFNVKIRVFSIGFGSEICGWYDRYGTRWRLSWIPLGGYVSFMDDSDEQDVISQIDESGSSYDGSSFFVKPLYMRTAIVAAGPFASFLLAIMIFTSIFFFIGEKVPLALDLIPASITKVVEDSAAADAGLQAGDLVLSVDQQKIDTFTHFKTTIIQNSSFDPMKIVVERGGSNLIFHITPHRMEVKDQLGNKKVIPVLGAVHKLQAGEFQVISYGLPRAFVRAMKKTWFITGRIFDALKGCFLGRQGVDTFGGPLMIASISKHAADAGFVSLLDLSAILSLSVGVLNLLPFPMLDGGHLLFYAIEKIRGYPLSRNIQNWCLKISFFLLISLAITVTWNDLLNLKIF